MTLAWAFVVEHLQKLLSNPFTIRQTWWGG
jgi:hypothetical protein